MSEPHDIIYISRADVSYLEDLLLDEKKQLKILPYETLKDVPQEHLSQFCVKHGFYSIPTIELISFLSGEIEGHKEKTVEIGAGNGAICRELGIIGTDNFMQLMLKYRMKYEQMGQAVVSYGDHVVKIEALAAVIKYKPDVVIGAWVTHRYNPREHWRGGNERGVDMKKLLRKVKKIILVGNEGVHKNSPIMEKPHRTVKAPWILSRSITHRESNRIFIWER